MKSAAIVVEGPPLGGKTTLAHQLADFIDVILFIQDDIHTELLPGLCQ